MARVWSGQTARIIFGAAQVGLGGLVGYIWGGADDKPSVEPIEETIEPEIEASGSSLLGLAVVSLPAVAALALYVVKRHNRIQLERSIDARQQEVPIEAQEAGCSDDTKGEWLYCVEQEGRSFVLKWKDAQSELRHLRNSLILQNAPLPYAPMDEKRRWFEEELRRMNAPYRRSHISVTVNRQAALHDSFRLFATMSSVDLRKSMSVRFEGEEGVDAGGLSREWFRLVGEAMFSVETGLFEYVFEDHLNLNISPGSDIANELHLQYFRFAGRLMGKALLERQLLPAPLCAVLAKHLCRTPLCFADLHCLDSTLATNLAKLMQEGDVDALALDFTACERRYGMSRTVALKGGGESCEVGDGNKAEYTRLLCQHHLGGAVRQQLAQLMMGLYELVPEHMLSLFTHDQFMLLLSGDPDPDLQDWEQHTQYAHGYSRQSTTVRHFWSLLASHLTPSQRATLLCFVTGSSRVPSAGFAQLPSTPGNISRFTLYRQPCPALPLLSTVPRKPTAATATNGAAATTTAAPAVFDEAAAGDSTVAAASVGSPAIPTCEGSPSATADGSSRDVALRRKEQYALAVQRRATMGHAEHKGREEEEAVADKAEAAHKGAGEAEAEADAAVPQFCSCRCLCAAPSVALCMCSCDCAWGHSRLPLPVAHTCFNRLDLPAYPTRAALLNRLLLAIRSLDAGSAGEGAAFYVR